MSLNTGETENGALHCLQIILYVALGLNTVQLHLMFHAVNCYKICRFSPNGA